MKLELDEWAELWFRHQVNQGMHPGLVLTILEQFRRAIPTIDGRDGGPMARLVTQSERYVIVELAATAPLLPVLAIFCRRCCSTSFNANDVQQLYCGHCKQFHH